MRTRISFPLALTGCLVSLSLARAQVPAIPAATPPALPAIPGAPPPPLPPVAPPNNLWSFLFPTPAQCAQCKAHFCASPLGQITAAMGQPMAAFTGGLFGNCCPLNGLNPADLGLPPDSGQGAAALVKADAAGAAARRAAIRYLGTVDCRYWPEAEAALINGLRADKIECVRWEAALALQRGCCCTTKIILALTISVSGGDSDGFPAECSPRVRDAAAVALSMCVATQPGPVMIEAPIAPPPFEILPTPAPKKGTPPEPLPPPTPDPKTAAKLAAQKQAKDAYRAKVVEYARRVLSEYYHLPIAQITPGLQPPPTRLGANGLVGLMIHAANTGTTETAAPPLARPTPVGPVVTSTPPSGLLNLAGNWLRNGSTAAPTETVVLMPPVPATFTTAGWQRTPNVPVQPSAAVGTMGARMPVGPSGGARVTSGYVEWDQ